MHRSADRRSFLLEQRLESDRAGGDDDLAEVSSDHVPQPKLSSLFPLLDFFATFPIGGSSFKHLDIPSRQGETATQISTRRGTTLQTKSTIHEQEVTRIQGHGYFL
jgi:hypothetical protein